MIYSIHFTIFYLDHFTKPKLINKAFGLDLFCSSENQLALDEIIFSPKSISNSIITNSTNSTRASSHPIDSQLYIFNKKAYNIDGYSKEMIELSSNGHFLPSSIKSLNQLGYVDNVNSNIDPIYKRRKCCVKNASKKLTELDEIKQTTYYSNNNQVELEINLIERLLKNLNSEKLIKVLQMKAEEEAIAIQKSNFPSETSLLNIRQQIKELQLTQFAESITSVHRNKQNLLYYVTLDKTELYPCLELNEQVYKYFMSYLDTSNFILSYDKPLNSQLNPIG